MSNDEENAPLTLNTPGLYIHAEIRMSGDELPIVVMIHGFPQSSEMWKYVLDRLPPNLPVYVPDIPGYGRSTLDVMKPSYSKREVGTVILDSLQARLDNYPGRSSCRQKIILVGHDRGARIAHRLSVDNNHPHFEIIGAALMDIVPTLVQWEGFSDPTVAVGYYHWPFLAVPSPIMADMILAYGGGRWLEEHMKLDCMNEEGRKRFAANCVFYKKYFSDHKTIVAACADYRAGATVDYEEQKRDQKEGRKLKIPILSIYSEQFVGKHFDLCKVWKDWVDDERLLRLRKMEDGIGHCMAEEDPDSVANELLGWFRENLNIRV